MLPFVVEYTTVNGGKVWGCLPVCTGPQPHTALAYLEKVVRSGRVRKVVKYQ